MSQDGRFVLFVSDADNVVGGDTNSVTDIFLRDRMLKTTTRINVDAKKNQANNYSYTEKKSICRDGSYVVYASIANHLVDQDTNGKWDIFVYETATGKTSIISTPSSYPMVESDGDSQYPSISANGRYVVFTSTAKNLVPGDTNGSSDVFLYDRVNKTMQRVSTDRLGNEGNGDSKEADINNDGSFVAFSSKADNLVPGDSHISDVFLKEVGIGGYSNKWACKCFSTGCNSRNNNPNQFYLRWLRSKWK